MEIKSRKESRTKRYRKTPLISLFELGRVFFYDPETGHFYRRVTTGQKGQFGSKAGTLTNPGYWAISINGKPYLAHRLAWFYVYGTWPKDQIDHINRNRADNRISNLREATCSQNLRNTKRRSNNTSGHKGVNWSKIAKKWQSTIRIDGKRQHLGYYHELEDASTAYQVAASKYYGKFARFQ